MVKTLQELAFIAYVKCQIASDEVQKMLPILQAKSDEYHTSMTIPRSVVPDVLIAMDFRKDLQDLPPKTITAYFYVNGWRFRLESGLWESPFTGNMVEYLDVYCYMTIPGISSCRR
jgi:hypothetical protein